MTEKPKVYQAISNVMKEIGETGISKDHKNTQQGYKFRGIDDVYNSLNPILAKHCLVLLPRVIEKSQTERQTKSGGTLIYTMLTVEFTAAHTQDASTAQIVTVGEAMDSADKSSNKAMAAAYKYAAMMLFCIPTEGDNDADLTTHTVEPKKPPEMIGVNGQHGASKAANRDGYNKMVKEIRDAVSVFKLDEWYKANVTAVDAMSPDWVDELRIEFSDKKSELKEKAAS